MLGIGTGEVDVRRERKDFSDPTNEMGAHGDDELMIRFFTCHDQDLVQLNRTFRIGH